MSCRVDLSLKVVPTEKEEKEKRVKIGTVKLHNTPGIQSLLTFIRTVLSTQMLFCSMVCCVHAPIWSSYLIIVS